MDVKKGAPSVYADGRFKKRPWDRPAATLVHWSPVPVAWRTCPVVPATPLIRNWDVFTLVVVREFAEYTFKKDATFEPVMDP